MTLKLKGIKVELLEVGIVCIISLDSKCRNYIVPEHIKNDKDDYLLVTAVHVDQLRENNLKELLIIDNEFKRIGIGGISDIKNKKRLYFKENGGYIQKLDTHVKFIIEEKDTTTELIYSDFMSLVQMTYQPDNLLDHRTYIINKDNYKEEVYIEKYTNGTWLFKYYY